jgi:flagellar basal-body rod modification protein FlgD
MSTSAIGGTGGATSLAQTIAGNQKLGQGEFLKLLITQLTTQDPLSPQDDKEFLAQMAQFSAVEGISNLNTTLDRTQAASFINKTVDANVLEGGAYKAVSGTVKAVTYQSDGVHLLVKTSNGDRDVSMSDLTKVSG